MPDVILSPHLDDAVLSCWHLLTQVGEVAVINVFAGVPTELGGPAWWDEYTGASDSAERVRERIEEDRTALAVPGRPIGDPEVLGYEVIWPTAPPARAAQRAGRHR